MTFAMSTNHGQLVAVGSGGNVQVFPAATVASYGADPAAAIAGALGVSVDDLPGLDAALVAISATVDGLVTTQRASDADRARSILSTRSDA